MANLNTKKTSSITSVKVSIAVALMVSLGGCAAAPFIGAAAGAATLAAGNQRAVETHTSYASKVAGMNCNSLRSEYSRLGKNPFGGLSTSTAERKAMVYQTMKNRGCRMS